jgi:transposase-like protein
MVQETEKSGVAVAQVCRRHGIATSLLFRWRVQFGLTARKAPQLATVALTDGAANEVPALTVLRDLVKPPDGTQNGWRDRGNTNQESFVAARGCAFKGENVWVLRTRGGHSHRQNQRRGQESNALARR